MNNQYVADNTIIAISSDRRTVYAARSLIQETWFRSCRIRINAAARNPGTVGSILHQYRTQTSLTEQELADWLGVDLPILADLAEEIRPERRPVLTGHEEMGLDQLAELYGADRQRLLEAFEHGDCHA